MRRMIIMLGWMLAIACAPAPAAFAADCMLKVGVVPQFEQRKLFAIWTPILEQMERKTGCQFELMGSENISTFEQAFQEGAYDIAYMNPYHAIMAHQAQGYTPLLRSGSKKLKGILVVHKDNLITDVKELEGKTIAFPSPNALGASLLMRAELANKHGITFTPSYVKTHPSVYLHVGKKRADAGGGVGRTLKEQPDYIKNALRILYTTEPVPAHPLVAHPRLDASLRDMIQNTFLELAEKQPELTDKIPMKEPIVTSLEDYSALKEMGLDAFVESSK